MTSSGMELVRRYRELIAAGHVDQALDLLSEDFEFTAPDGSTLVLSDVKEMWSGSGPDFDHLTLEILQTGLHDMVFRWKETGEISNVEHRAMLFEVGAGKIRKMRFFTQPEEAWTEAGVASA